MKAKRVSKPVNKKGRTKLRKLSTGKSPAIPQVIHKTGYLEPLESPRRSRLRHECYQMGYWQGGAGWSETRMPILPDWAERSGNREELLEEARMTLERGFRRGVQGLVSREADPHALVSKGIPTDHGETATPPTPH